MASPFSMKYKECPLLAQNFKIMLKDFEEVEIMPNKKGTYVLPNI